MLCAALANMRFLKGSVDSDNGAAELVGPGTDSTGVRLCVAYFFKGEVQAVLHKLNVQRAVRVQWL